MPQPYLTIIPDLVLTALILIALITDTIKHKISNRLVLSVLTLGIFSQCYTSGLIGIAHSLFGIIAGFLIFMPFNLAGGMRGGDLKLMSAIGAFLTFDTPIAAGLCLLAGAVLGIFVLCWRGGGYDYYIRYSTMLIEATSLGRWHYEAPVRGEAAASSFPYASAIATGTFLTMIFFR